MESVSLLYVTTGNDDEAQRIASALVRERLVACANIIPGMQSFYWWQGEVQNDTEVVLIVKTRAALVATVTERIRTLHSYECPCVVELPVASGNPAFLDWIGTETAGAVPADR